MKKIRPLLFFFILSVFLFSFSILATTITLEGVEIDSSKLLVPDESWKYSLIYQEESLEELSEGQQVVILVVKGIASKTSDLVISADTIQYIDQTASTDTKVEFLGFMPKKVPNCTVLLGGITGGPKIVGYIEAEPVSVKGKVKIEGLTPATIELVDEFNHVQSFFSDLPAKNSGIADFLLEKVKPGNYSFKISKFGHTSHSQTIAVEEFDLYIGSFIIYGGDFNHNGSINVYDLGLLLDDYGKDVKDALNTACDINENGSINVYDLSIFLDNYGKQSIKLN